MLDSIPIRGRYRRVVQIEYNEISRPVVERLMADGHLPGFAKLDQEWSAYETVAESEYKLLEPWIQWPTVHTGLPFEGHQLFHLADADRLEVPQIWETLSRMGVESGILGSMNARRGDSRGGVFFPDPWSRSNDAEPESLRPLWHFVSSRVQGHAVAPPGKRDALRGLLATARFRIPPRLYARIARQVLRQRTEPESAWRLASLFDELLGEMFLHLARTTDFGFYTLFLNSVAHYQHHFWRNFQPELFDDSVRPPDCSPDDDPIREGYLGYDALLTRILSELDEDTLVVVCGGLSQVPFTEMEHQGGMNYYRLKDHSGFAARLGLKRCRVVPLMSRDWQIDFDDLAAMAEGRAVLETLRVAGEPVFAVRDNGHRTLFVESAVTRGPLDDETIHGPLEPGRFGDHFANIAVKSGHHDSRGMLWISEPPELPGLRQVRLGAIHDLTLDALGLNERASSVA